MHFEHCLGQAQWGYTLTAMYVNMHTNHEWFKTQVAETIEGRPNVFCVAFE